MNKLISDYNHTNLCRIKHNCIIIALVTIFLTLSACAPHSVRVNSKSYAKIRNNEAISKDDDKNLANNIQNSGGFVSNQQLEPLITPSNDEGSVESPASGSDFGSSRKIPTLREQMKIYTTEQNTIKEKVTGIQEDVDDIKTALADLKESIKAVPNVKFKSAESGETYIKETFIQPDEEINGSDKTIILPDEAIKRKNASPSDGVQPRSKKTIKSMPEKNVYANDYIDSRNNDAVTLKSKPAKPLKTKQAAVPDQYARTENGKKATPNAVPVQTAQSSTQAFQPALDLIAKKDYQNAIIELNGLLETVKDPCLVGTGNYWLGESYFALKQFDRSIICFNKVLQTKGCAKKDNAQLMIAESHVRSGQYAEAKKAFQGLIDNYPQSELIPRARKMLQQM